MASQLEAEQQLRVADSGVASLVASSLANVARQSRRTMTTTAKPTSDFLTTAVQSAKRRIFSQVPNKKQVDLVSDGSVKRRTKWVLFTAAFIDLSGVPSEIVDVVVSMLCRAVFDFALWNTNRPSLPILLVCEEAHRYIGADDAGFGPGGAPTARRHLCIAASFKIL